MHRTTEWIKISPLHLLPTGDSRWKGTQTFQCVMTGKGWERYFMKMGKKKAGIAILLSDKTDFKTTAVTRDKEGPTIRPLGTYVKKTNSQRSMHPSVNCSITYNSQYIV